MQPATKATGRFFNVPKTEKRRQRQTDGQQCKIQGMRGSFKGLTGKRPHRKKQHRNDGNKSGRLQDEMKQCLPNWSGGGHLESLFND